VGGEGRLPEGRGRDARPSQSAEHGCPYSLPVENGGIDANGGEGKALPWDAGAARAVGGSGWGKRKRLESWSRPHAHVVPVLPRLPSPSLPSFPLPGPARFGGGICTDALRHIRRAGHGNDRGSSRASGGGDGWWRREAGPLGPVGGERRPGGGGKGEGGRKGGRKGRKGGSGCREGSRPPPLG
jgi:hypothetical protein